MVQVVTLKSEVLIVEGSVGNDVGPLQIQGQQPRQNLIIAEVIRRRPTIGGKHGGTGVAIIEVAVV